MTRKKQRQAWSGPAFSAEEMAQIIVQANRDHERERDEAARNVIEFARMFLFALTDHDKPHQDHARKMLETWLDKADVLVPNGDPT